MAAPPPIDGEILVRVADCLKVPDEKRPAFFRCLVAAIREAWRGHGICHAMPRRSPVIKILEKMRKATPARIAKILASRDSDNEAARTLLACHIGPHELSDWIVTASAHELNAAIDKAQKSAGRLRDGGRTPGTPGNPSFDLFIACLYHYAAAFGGQPGNASRKGADPVKGPMVKALDLLRPELPEKFSPSDEGSLLNTIRRAKKYYDAA